MAENFGIGDRGAADDAAFAERVAAPLRAPERAHPSLEKRLMDRVRMEGPALYPARADSHASWWWTRRVFEYTPLTGLAAAAGVTAIVALSSVAIGTRIGSRNHDVARPTTAAVKPDRNARRLTCMVMGGRLYTSFEECECPTHARA